MFVRNVDLGPSSSSVLASHSSSSLVSQVCSVTEEHWLSTTVCQSGVLSLVTLSQIVSIAGQFPSEIPCLALSLLSPLTLLPLLSLALLGGK